MPTQLNPSRRRFKGDPPERKSRWKELGIVCFATVVWIVWMTAKDTFDRDKAPCRAWLVGYFGDRQTVEIEWQPVYASEDGVRHRILVLSHMGRVRYCLFDIEDGKAGGGLYQDYPAIWKNWYGPLTLVHH